MTRCLTFAVVALALTACDGDSNADATVDTPFPACPTSYCNPLAQTGCAVAERCAWIHGKKSMDGCVALDCAAAGSLAEGAACTPPMLGFDDCARGTVCHAGTCKRICDVAGGAPTCERGDACRSQTTVLVGLAGVCEPS